MGVVRRLVIRIRSAFQQFVHDRCLVVVRDSRRQDAPIVDFPRKPFFASPLLVAELQKVKENFFVPFLGTCVQTVVSPMIFHPGQAVDGRYDFLHPIKVVFKTSSEKCLLDQITHAVCRWRWIAEPTSLAGGNFHLVFFSILDEH